MKTKEELQEDVGLVRDVEAWARAKCADDTERAFQAGLFRKATAELPKLEIPHVRRINEALCDVEFPSPSALELRRALLMRLASHHNLRAYRTQKSS